MRRRRGSPLVGILLLTLLAGACRSTPTDVAEPSPAPESPAAEEPPETDAESDPSEEESPEPDRETARVARELRFTAPRLGGGQIRGAEYAGRDVAIWFWAPW